MRKSLKIWVFCCSCLLLVSWDKTMKEMAKEHLKDKGPVSYFHDMNIGVANIRTGIFNFADVWVTAGAIALIIVYRKRSVPDVV